MTPRFKVGDRIKIRRSWSELDGAVGTVASPTDAVGGRSGFGSDYFRQETTLTGGSTIVYWVALDAHGAEPGESGEFDETELDKL